MTDDDIVIECLDEWDWALTVTADGEVEARKPVKHDGVQFLSTRSRPNTVRKNSRYHMAETRVVEEYAVRSDTEREYDELLREVRAALEDMDD